MFAVPTDLGYLTLGALVFGESGGLPIPGETALIAAAGLAAAGNLSLPLVIAVAVLAAIVGDTLGYGLGRRKGRSILLRDGRFASHRRRAVSRADRFFERNGVLTVFAGRFIPGVRVVAAMGAGAARMSWRRFAPANAAGAVAWAGGVATVAYLLGPGGAAALAGAGLIVGPSAIALLAGGRLLLARAGAKWNRGRSLA